MAGVLTVYSDRFGPTVLFRQGNVMQVYIGKLEDFRKSDAYPCEILEPNNWDDFGYKTTFSVQIRISPKEVMDLESVKILRMQQDGGRTELPDSPFTSLSEEYCSFGGTIEYYEALFKAGPHIFQPYLAALRDIVYDRAVREEFEVLEGYQVSLLRFPNATGVISDAAQLFQSSSTALPSPVFENIEFRFQTRLVRNATPFSIEFDFRAAGALPHRVNAVIGYNGCGKTRLLSNLAIVCSGYGYENKHDILHKTVGKFLGPPPAFDRVVVVSYSAFDTFAIPGGEQTEKARLLETGDIFGYAYCGLRVPLDDHAEEEKQYRLRTPAEVEQEFDISLARIRTTKANASFIAALRPLLNDASFRKVSFGALVDSSGPTSWMDEFRRLSSGHKIVLKIVTDLVAQMSGARQSLVLIDEPETHLHPPLLAALLKSIRICLEELNGYAVIATHSPVVLQETPSRFVRVLQRAGDLNSVRRCTLETFGEDIGLITEQVFNLDDTATDWHSTLLSLSKEMKLEQMEKLFGKKLGFGPRSYVVGLQDEYKPSEEE